MTKFPIFVVVLKCSAERLLGSNESSSRALLFLVLSCTMDRMIILFEYIWKSFRQIHFPTAFRRHPLQACVRRFFAAGASRPAIK